MLGRPLVDLGILLGDYYNDKSFWEVTIQDDERFLPKLLAKHGFTSSASEIRRNRKDLVKTLDKLDFLEIKLGKKRLWIVVGCKNEEEYNKLIKESED